MKREQMEAITSAAAGLLAVIEGAKSLSVYAHPDTPTTVCVRVETDEDVAALAGVFNRSPSHYEYGAEYYLAFNVTLSAHRLSIGGPYHDSAARKPTAPEKVTAAIADAESAIHLRATTADTDDVQKRAAVVVDALTGQMVKNRYGGLT